MNDGSEVTGSLALDDPAAPVRHNLSWIFGSKQSWIITSCPVYKHMSGVTLQRGPQSETSHSAPDVDPCLNRRSREKRAALDVSEHLWSVVKPWLRITNRWAGMSPQLWRTAAHERFKCFRRLKLSSESSAEKDRAACHRQLFMPLLQDK